MKDIRYMANDKEISMEIRTLVEENIINTYLKDGIYLLMIASAMYLSYFCREELQENSNIIKLLLGAETDIDPSYKSSLDYVFEAVEDEEDGAKVLAPYKKFRSYAVGYQEECIHVAINTFAPIFGYDPASISEKTPVEKINPYIFLAYFIYT